MYKKIKFKDLKFIPSSHEDFIKPAVVKKVFFTNANIPPETKIQMINWARLFKNKSFAAHYHEDMDEIFIMFSGKVKITIDNKTDYLNAGDAIYIRMGSIHMMENISKVNVDYIAIGLSRNKGGKTVIVK